MDCQLYHLGPFVRSPNIRLHGWLHPVWLRCAHCESDISPEEVRRAIMRAADEIASVPYVPTPAGSIS